jgi:hypothetical protein
MGAARSGWNSCVLTRRATESTTVTKKEAQNEDPVALMFYSDFIESPMSRKYFKFLICTMQGPKNQFFWFLETSGNVSQESHICITFVLLLPLVNQLLRLL